MDRPEDTIHRLSPPERWGLLSSRLVPEYFTPSPRHIPGDHEIDMFVVGNEAIELDGRTFVLWPAERFIVNQIALKRGHGIKRDEMIDEGLGSGIKSPTPINLWSMEKEALKAFTITTDEGNTRSLVSERGGVRNRSYVLDPDVMVRRKPPGAELETWQQFDTYLSGPLIVPPGAKYEGPGKRERILTLSDDWPFTDNENSLMSLLLLNDGWYLSHNQLHALGHNKETPYGLEWLVTLGVTVQSINHKLGFDLIKIADDAHGMAVSLQHQLTINDERTVISSAPTDEMRTLLSDVLAATPPTEIVRHPSARHFQLARVARRAGRVSVRATKRTSQAAPPHRPTPQPPASDVEIMRQVEADYASGDMLNRILVHIGASEQEIEAIFEHFDFEEEASEINPAALESSLARLRPLFASVESILLNNPDYKNMPLASRKHFNSIRRYFWQVIGREDEDKNFVFRPKSCAQLAVEDNHYADKGSEFATGALALIDNYIRVYRT